MWEGHGFGGGFMGFFWLIVLVLIVWAVIALAKSGSSTDSRPQKPIELLKERYARGEISQEEYETMRKDLLN